MHKINICGIKHEIAEVNGPELGTEYPMGEIDYGKAQIKINMDLADEVKLTTLCHEILHGMFVHVGREDLAQDEQLVTALGNAISASFKPKVENDD